MEIIVRSGAIERHQMNKEVAKPAALKQLTKIFNQEQVKSTDPWYRSRVDWVEAGKNARKYGKNLNNVTPEKLTAGAKDMMWKRAKQLKDEFIVGMLSKEELHPVKGFSENGKMVWVVDEGKMNALKSVDRNEVWYKRNEVKLREFKQIMRHLCPDDPNAGDVEKFRPRNRGVR